MKSSVALVFGAAVIGASAAVSSVCYCGTGNGNEVNEELTFLACEAYALKGIYFDKDGNRLTDTSDVYIRISDTTKECQTYDRYFMELADNIDSDDFAAACKNAAADGVKYTSECGSTARGP